MKLAGFVRKSAELFLVFLVSCLFTLGPGSIARASTLPRNIHEEMSAAATGFHVSGRFLLEANGSNFIMRGINAPHNWFPEETISSFQNIKAKGANTVRVVLSSGQNWPKNSASDVANVINLCKTNKLVCVLEVHDTTGYGEDAGATTLAQAVSYWKEIKSVLVGQEAYVIINIGNEPYGNINAANWVNATKNAIAEMRNAGFQHMLMVDAPDWGQDWEFIMRNNAASVFNSDPLKNTVFSIHMYGVFDTAAKVQNYVSTFVNAGLPLVIGEFGHFHTDGDPDEDTILSTAQGYGIGYLGWSWSGNSQGGEYLDMVNNFNPNQETWWGNRIIHGPNGIAGTSQEASIYGSTNPDADTTGVFRPTNGALYLKNKNETGFADVQINYGLGGDTPVVGDWDGNGSTTIGIYRNGSFYLRNSNTIGFADTVLPFGMPGDQPVAGDWNGDGVDTIGVYRGGTFYLRNSNSSGAPEMIFALGIAGDVGIAGDWNGDGMDTTGVFRPSNGALYLKNTNSTGFADIQINYGLPGDKPVTGDWDNDGIDTIGVYRNGMFMLRNSNTIGIADLTFPFGVPGDQPVAGDWDGNGTDTVGVYRPSSGQFLLRNSNTPGDPDLIFSLGIPGDVGLAGDWNGDGKDTTGVFRPSNGALYLKNNNTTGVADIQINYGIAGDKPVTGDWNNDGIDTIGVYRGNIFYLRNSNTIGFADIVFALGVNGDLPIAGDWDARP
jgi:mannan endo-1,4-beta-mannosidase